MAGLKAMFGMNQVRDYLQEKVDRIEQGTLEALQYAGEEFVNNARMNGAYTDRTGNLRASIGYVILKDGKEIYSSFPGETEQGPKVARRESKRIVLDEVSQTDYRGYVLVGIAGMQYAAAVESLGYDVITGSEPGEYDIKDLLGAIKL
tara:strand:+ start:799 stop:1242 length:444 start_codon:yes stop_codon:yes gene_type:complete